MRQTINVHVALFGGAKRSGKDFFANGVKELLMARQYHVLTLNTYFLKEAMYINGSQPIHMWVNSWQECNKETPLKWSRPMRELLLIAGEALGRDFVAEVFVSQVEMVINSIPSYCDKPVVILVPDLRHARVLELLENMFKEYSNKDGLKLSKSLFYIKNNEAEAKKGTHWTETMLEDEPETLVKHNLDIIHNNWQSHQNRYMTEANLKYVEGAILDTMGLKTNQ
jgi:hypothetical protein